MSLRLMSMVVLLMWSCGAAGEDWVKSMTSADCRPESRERIARSTRERIERSVHRAEASVQRPRPVGDLTCLDRLMAINVGSFAPVGDLLGMFRGALDQLGDDGARRICRVAEDAWRRRSQPLTFGVSGQSPRSLSERRRSSPGAAEEDRSGSGAINGDGSLGEVIWQSIYGRGEGR